MLLLIYLLVICCPFIIFSSLHHSHVRNNIQAVKYSISRLILCNSPLKYCCRIFIICGFWSNFVLLFFKINYFWKSKKKKSKDMYQHKIKVWTIIKIYIMKIWLEGINRRTLNPSTNGQKLSFVKYNSEKNVKGIRLKVNTIFLFNKNIQVTKISLDFPLLRMASIMGNAPYSLRVNVF